MPDTAVVMGISRTLQALLVDRVEPPQNVPGLPVTISTPQPDPEATPAPEATRLNLFLYRITENGELKNQESPGRGNRGAYGHPPLCLSLHYLLTAYGSTDDNGFLNETRAQFVLGGAMRVLHDHSELTERLITVRPPSGEPLLDPVLLGQPAPIRITLDPLTLDDLTKIWTALTLPYRLSAAYEVQVARIESRRPRRVVKPVGEPPTGGPRIHVTTLRSPRIGEVRVRRDGGAESPFPYVRIGDTVILLGNDFGGDDTRVRLGGLPLPVADPSAGRVEVVVPDAELPGGIPIPDERRLQPGPLPITVLVGVRGVPGRAVASNQTVVMLVPRVVTVALDATVVPRTLTVTGARLFRPDREGETVIGPVRVDKAAYAAAAPTRLTVPLPDTLPSRAVHGLLSSPLVPFPQLPNELELTVTMGTEQPLPVSLAGRPTTLEAAARLLQSALRDTANGGPLFRGAHVVATEESRLLIVPGGLSATVAVAESPTASALGFRSPDTRLVRHARLSGPLLPLPTLTAAQPRLDVTIGADRSTLILPRHPVTLVDLAELLHLAMRTGSGPGFEAAEVAVLDQQLLLVPGTDATIEIAPAADADTTTPTELQMRAKYSVRVRVDGAESIDPTTVELP